ncbi:DUF2202 domain-containing protein [Gudongella sp. DL1XJH-153]|uniref:DUF2202 domain-containing protein n=1 Tax=Gudongella sp. DL1XJH-153 TaxID=3409804 RepID=UPI003BB5E67E
MKKSIKRTIGTIMALGVILSSSTGITAFAQSSDIGAGGALSQDSFTIEEMLNFSIEDEYLALEEYKVIIEKFEVNRPFTNILKAEETHVSLLEPLFEKYELEIPSMDWGLLVVTPESLEEAYEIGVDAEIINISMYEKFLDQDLPDDVRLTFERLKTASENHLDAFERQVERGSSSADNGARGNGRVDGNYGKSSNGFGGNNQRNKVLNIEDCPLG